MTLRTRLVLGLAAVALLLAVPLGFALRALNQAERAAGELRAQEVAASLLLGRIRTTTQNLRDADKAVLFAEDTAASRAWMARETRALRAYADSLTPLDLDALAREIRRSAQAIGTHGPRQWAAVDQGSAGADDISAEHIVPAIEAVERVLSESEGALVVRAQQRADEAAVAASDAFSLAGLLLAAALAGSLVVAYWLTRSISGPVRDLERGMAAVAGGKFGHQLTFTDRRPDEFGRLAASYRQMAEQLAELDKLKAEFVSVASHELKTPINVMLGYVALVQEGLYGPVTAAQADVLRTVEAQGQQLTRLVQHLLDVSRFRAGAGRIEARPVALRPFLTDLERAHAVLAHQRGLTLTLTADAALPDVVSWDVDRMAEVLGNLLANAVKFTPSGGRVTLIAEPAPDLAAVDLKRPGPALRLVVEDTGVGIAPAQLPHIFDKFYQADNQARASSAGSGLGLAIAKQIVEAHGGVIGVESTPDVGTRFVMLIPVDAAGTATPAIGIPAVGAPSVAARADVGGGGGPDRARPAVARSEATT